ncbi:hypothetical protein [Vineibacter terrae]|uniref:hypothetical protein n=1 Tax=Vineibacter terrae TaxID=2586908 RepID=UPI0015B49AAE|nr:hypothetical protein [Vineibacter terrae]
MIDGDTIDIRGTRIRLLAQSGTDFVVSTRAEVIDIEVVLMALCYRHLFHEGVCVPTRVRPAPDAHTIRYVRDCFDRLFYHYSQLQKLVFHRVTNLRDVRYPTEYHSHCINMTDLRRIVFEHFLLVNFYDDAIDFLISLDSPEAPDKWRFLRFERSQRRFDRIIYEEPWRTSGEMLSLTEFRNLTPGDRRTYCYRRLDRFISTRCGDERVGSQKISYALTAARPSHTAPVATLRQ